MQTNPAVATCRDSRDPEIGVPQLPATLGKRSEAVLDRHFNGKRVEAIKVRRELTVTGLLRSEGAICNLDNVPVVRAAMTAILESRIGG